MVKKSNKQQSTREKVGSALRDKLDANHSAGVEEMQKKMEEYQRQLEEQVQATLSKESSKTNKDLQDAEMQITGEQEATAKAGKESVMEDNVMAKKPAKELFNNDNVEDFGAGAVNETQQTQQTEQPTENQQVENSGDLTLPMINESADDIKLPDEGAEMEKKAKEEQKEKPKEKATTGEYEGNLVDDILKANPNIKKMQDYNGKITILLRETVFIKQLVTVGDFGRGMTITTRNLAAKGQTPDKVAHIKIDQLKPGRAKSVVVTMPKKLREILTATSTTSLSTMRRNIMSVLEANDLTAEERADTVDVVMKYDTLCARIANLFEGYIAEFGGVDGPLDAKINSKWVPKKDSKTGVLSYEEKDLKGNLENKLITAKNHVFYKMGPLNSRLMGKRGKGEALNDTDLKILQRWKDGKVPLKRLANGYSALYTPLNYTPTIKYRTAQPFADNLTDETAQRLSAKVVWQYMNRGTDAPRMESYDANMVNVDKGVLRVFDPSIDVNTRMDELCTAKGYCPTRQDGTPLTRSVRRLDANGKSVKDASGNWIYDDIPYTAKDTEITDRRPKNYYTGAPLSGDELKAVEFVMYGTSETSKAGKSMCPRVQKDRISFETLQANIKETKGIMGTFGINDESVSRFVNLVGEEVAKNAFIEAYNTTRSSGKGGSGVEYEEGLLSAILES